MTKKLLVLAALVALAGCSKIMPKLDKIIPDTRTEYRKSRSLPDLEVPPDLSTDAIKDRMAIPGGGDTATYSSYQERAAKRKQDRELERSANDAIKVLDNEHTLSVQGAPKQVWPQLRKFMADSNYKLDLDDEDLGVIETVWDEDAEALTRQKYKIVAEASQDSSTTLLYVSQRVEGMSKKGDQMAWQPQARDPAQEREMVSRLQAFLVGARAPATTAARPATGSAAPAVAATAGVAAAAAGASQLTADEAYGAGASAPTGKGMAEVVSAGGEKIYLSINQSLDDCWDNAGVALERAGYAVDQADRGKGTYYLRVAAGAGAVKKRGLLSKMKFWGKDEDNRLQINLTQVGSHTEAVVLDREGRWETGEIARKLLEDLKRGLEARAQG